MMNLLTETTSVLKTYGKSLNDIIAVQGSDFAITVEDFIKLADVTYNDGYGSPEVAEDLLVIGDGWWLERATYDGSEWWEYKEYPKILPITEKNIFALTVNQSMGNVYLGWGKLSEMNGIKAEVVQWEE